MLKFKTIPWLPKPIRISDQCILVNWSEHANVESADFWLENQFYYLKKLIKFSKYSPPDWVWKCRE